jgi:glycosyltransferase involved in cell wall biosynthesis
MASRIFFFSSADILGGAERSLQTLITALRERGHDCVLVTPASAPLAQWAREIGLALENLDTDTLRQRNPLRALGAILRHRRFARSLIRKYGPGVFYSNTRHSFIMLAMLPASCPKIAHHRDAVSRPVNRLLYPRIDRNIFISEFNYRRSDAPPNGQIIYNAVAIDCDLPPVLPTPVRGPLRLAMFSRITPYKGHRLALDACRYLAGQGVEHSLDIWGEPGANSADRKLMQDLQARSEGERLPVAFRGFHPNPPAIMRDYHCILNPSRDEPFGRVPIEGFSLGVPVISNRSGGSCEIYAGLDCYEDYLFDAYTGEALGDAIRALLVRAEDPEGEGVRLGAIRDDIRCRFGTARLADEVAAVVEAVAT